jgi:3-phenylpropionate/cinnamic acid dioxygenase small subunit
MSISSAATKREVVHDIEQFLYWEARLLDECKFQDWLNLLTEDIRYWMPVMSRRYAASSKSIIILDPDHYEEREFSKENELALMDETKESLARRISRLDTGMAWAEDPPSRTCRIIANVGVCEGDSESEMIVYSNFILYRTRGELEQDFYVGSRQDVLRSIGGDWRISYRKIIVPQNVLSAKNASNFF